jgi:hypothetical protein
MSWLGEYVSTASNAKKSCEECGSKRPWPNLRRRGICFERQESHGNLSHDSHFKSEQLPLELISSVPCPVHEEFH